MIFISVGTHYLPFDRLLQMTNRMLERRIIDEEVVVQSGTSTVRVDGALQRPSWSFNWFINLLRRARIIICHAGPATIFQSIALAHKRPIVVPRLKEHGEHVSDHQLHFAREWAKAGKIYLALTQRELEKQVISYRPESVKWQSQSVLAERLHRHLNGLP